MWATSSGSTRTANCSTRRARSGRPGWPRIRGSAWSRTSTTSGPGCRPVDREASDEVLLALAMLAAPDGGDDIAAAAALAKCLLPGACRLAGWLSTLPPREVFRDSQPVMAGAWSAVERVNELVASQLWIEVRTFPWRRRSKVAANILINTRVGVLREVGDFFYVSRADRTWANTDPRRVLRDRRPDGGDGGAWSPAGADRAGRRRAVPPSRMLADAEPEQEEPSAAEELLELLGVGLRARGDQPRGPVPAAVPGRGGRPSRDPQAGARLRRPARQRGVQRVAPRIGVSEATVRRHGSAACAPSPRPPRGSSAMTTHARK